MSLATRVLDTLRALMVRATGGWYGPFGLQDKALQALFGSPPSSSGIAIDETKALNASVVWACTQLIAGTLGSLPLIHYRRLPNGGKERATDTRLYRILHDTPNDDMSASTWAETMTVHVLLWGNAFSEIRWDNRGQVGALWPIEPWRVTAERKGREIRYVVDGSTKLTPDEMLHIPGLTPDGVWGYSPVQKARESLGLLLAAERFGGNFFGQGATFGGILTHPGRLSEAAEKTLRESLEKRAKGVERASNFIILQEGVTYEQLGIPPNDSQFLETRKFQVSEIARWFGVPPHMIGDVERSTSWGTGIEAQNIGFVTYTLRRWLVRFEQEITRKLISPLERNLQFVEFLVDGLLRGDTASRYAAYNIGRNGGWFSANDIRRLENLDPIADGDRYLVPSNTVPADRLDEIIDKQTAPAAPAAPTDPVPAIKTGGGRALDELFDEIQEFIALSRENFAKPPPIPLDPSAFVERTVEQTVEQIKALPAPPPTDLTPVLERLETLEHERQAHAERLAAILPSVQLMIEDVARDFVRREGDRARHAAVAPEKLAAWIEDFYPRQADYAVKKFRGAMQVYTDLVGRPEATEPDIRACLVEYVTESRRALSGLLALPPEDVKPAAEHLTQRWESERPAELARTLMAGSLVIPAVRTMPAEPSPPAPPPSVTVPITVVPVAAEQHDGETLVVEKEVLERDSVGRAQRIRETHTRKKPS